MAPLSVEGNVIARTPGLVPMRRGERVLVVAPRTGAAVLLEGERLRAFGRLERPVPARALRQDLPGDQLEAFLQELDLGGFLCVAGRPPRPPQERRERPEFRAVLQREPHAVEEDLPPGRLLVELVGCQDAETLRAAVDRLRSLRPGSVVWVRTCGALLSQPDTGAHLALCLSEVPSEALVRRLHEALARGLSVAPVAVVTRPGQALELFRALLDLGYRTMRFEGASAEDLVALAEAAAAFPVPLHLHPLQDLAQRLLEGTPGTLPDHPRCQRCAFGRTCSAEAGTPGCEEWRTLAEGLLWVLKSQGR